MSEIPLSHLRAHDGWLFSSGQIGRDADGNIPPDFAAQARIAIENLRGHLHAAGASLDSVIKTTVFLTRQSDFAEMNEIYSTYFTPPYPARSTIVAGMVRPELLFEIEAIATVQNL
jgi:2-iminobutanoate/2-iminopropanoate deaminase